jgi:hypothetical protein
MDNQHFACPVNVQHWRRLVITAHAVDLILDWVDGWEWGLSV